MCLLQRHAPPPLPSPCFPPGPSLLRHSARGDVGVGNSATHGGNATSERMALHEGEDLFSLQISIDPIGGLVHAVRKAKSAEIEKFERKKTGARTGVRHVS